MYLVLLTNSEHYYLNSSKARLLGGIIGVVPDFLWVARVIRNRSFNLKNNGNWFTRWHAGIQKLERPWGLWVELPLTAVLFYLVMIKFW